MHCETAADALGRLEGLVGARTGVVTKLIGARHTGLFWDGVELFNGSTGDLSRLYPGTRYVRQNNALHLVGSGCDVDVHAARLKAIMETLERYASAVVPEAEIVFTTAKRLGPDSFDWRTLPELHVRPHVGGAWRKYPFDPDEALRWVRGFNVTTGRDVYVPLVATRIHLAASEAESFMPQSTAGIAAHFGLENATLSALYEIIERDAVESVWAARLPLPRIDTRCFADRQLQSFSHLDENLLVDQRYYDASNEFEVPVVYAVRTLSSPIGNDVIVTASCHHNAEKAALKARLDASGQQTMRVNEAHGYPYTRYPGMPGFLVTDQQHTWPDLSFLDAVPTTSDVSLGGVEPDSLDADTVRSRLNRLLNRFSNLGHEVILVDLSTDELAKFGVRVVKAFVPTLLTVPPSENQRFLEHPRLLEKISRFRSSANVNLAPQPFC